MVYEGRGANRQWISEWDLHEFDEEWLDEGEDLFETVLIQFEEDFPQLWDDRDYQNLYDGWFNPGADRMTQAEARFEFFERYGYDNFPWIEWRLWYQREPA